jgi:NTP pyrophosphatase (non-canonical NTP hydrolase)
MGEIADIQKALEEFAIEKNWKKYHTIRNLVLALGSEVGELQAEFRWLTEEETINLSSDKLNSIKDEIADVAIFLFRISDLLKIDLNSGLHFSWFNSSFRMTFSSSNCWFLASNSIILSFIGSSCSTAFLFFSWDNLALSRFLLTH